MNAPVGPLMSVDTLARRLGDPALLPVDCRFDLADPASGARAWAQGHIPGAVHASLDDDLADLSRHGEGRHPLPDPAAFSRTLSRWGWQPDMTIVAYDAAGGALAAARLWWLLRLAGARAAVLDGGLAAWCAAGLPLESGVVEREATMVRVDFDRSQALGCEELERELAQPSTLLLDARAAARFRGEIEPIDARAGHVPGARNRPFADNLDADGRFKPAAVLRAEFEALLDGREPGAVVHMCGSGVTACHNLLAMDAAGLRGSRLFAPSWSGWSSRPGAAVATGDQAGRS
jgi:thiosulfate/3-mercaptopyruvate sulfurtransferase